jgi:hypothetical protein
MIKGKECIQRSLKDKIEGKRPLGRLYTLMEDNIKTDLRERGWGV